MPRRAWLLAPGAIAVRAAASLTVAVIESDGFRNRADKLGLQQAGLAILKTFDPGRRVFATHGQVEFYARSASVPFPQTVPLEDLEKILLSEPASVSR